MPRFYIPPEAWNPENLRLDADESHHCLHVLRCRPGDLVAAFNGRGAEASARIGEGDPKSVPLEILTLTQSPPPSAAVTLAQAIPKGKTMDLIVQKATELGAAAICPLVSERTIVQLDPDEAARRQGKWHRVAIEACKQSGQNWLPEVGKPTPVARFFESLPKVDLLVIASLEPDARHLKEILDEHRGIQHAPPKSTLVLIGPEGDFTPAEVNLAKSCGCQPMSLGPIVLRSETAALYALSVLGHELY